jgi:hypothetical protein
MTRTETESAAPEVVQDAGGAAEPQEAAIGVDAKAAKAAKAAEAADATVPERDAGDAGDAGNALGALDEELHAGLFPEGCTQTALEMVLLANPEVADPEVADPEVADKGVRVDAFATDAFVHASELQRTAVRFRMAAGASAADARASVAKSQGIDLARLFGVPAEAKAIAEVLFRQEDRKRKEPAA